MVKEPFHHRLIGTVFAGVTDKRGTKQNEKEKKNIKITPKIYI